MEYKNVMVLMSEMMEKKESIGKGGKRENEKEAQGRAGLERAATHPSTSDSRRNTGREWKPPDESASQDMRQVGQKWVTISIAEPVQSIGML